MTKLKVIESVILYFKNNESIIHENCALNEKYLFKNGSYVMIGYYFDTGGGWLELNGKRCNLTKTELLLIREVVALNHSKVIYF